MSLFEEDSALPFAVDDDTHLQTAIIVDSKNDLTKGMLFKDGTESSRLIQHSIQDPCVTKKQHVILKQLDVFSKISYPGVLLPVINAKTVPCDVGDCLDRSNTKNISTANREMAYKFINKKGCHSSNNNVSTHDKNRLKLNVQISSANF